MEDVWVLGGIFLEHSVTCFDFDGERLGFADPVEPVASGNVAALLNEVQMNKRDSDGSPKLIFEGPWLLPTLLMAVVGSVVSLALYVGREMRQTRSKHLPNPVRLLEEG